MADSEVPQLGLLRITIEHTPSPTDPEGADEIYKALGIMIVAWGRLEGQFVVCLLMLLNLPGGERLGNQLPMPFEGRATMWRKAFETIEGLQPFKEVALTHLAEIKDLANDRHVLVHALWEAFNPTSPTSISILNIKPKKKTKDGLETQRNTVTATKLRELGERISRLNVALAPLSQFLARYRSSHSPPPGDIRSI